MQFFQLPDLNLISLWMRLVLYSPRISTLHTKMLVNSLSKRLSESNRKPIRRIYFANNISKRRSAEWVCLSKERSLLDKKEKLGYGHSCQLLVHFYIGVAICWLNGGWPYAYRNYKPSESDLEDDSDDLNDDSDEDPAGWFEDDQDDGRKGQDIVEPDYEDLSSVIRIDESRIPRSIFYEPRDD